jgi:hypothetical protein
MRPALRLTAHAVRAIFCFDGRREAAGTLRRASA